MRLEVADSERAAAQRGAERIAAAARAAVQERGQAVVALSGGHTPWTMLELLARHELPWDRIVFCQVDERDCPEDSDDRNLKHIRAALPAAARIEPMPVERGDEGAPAYARSLAALAGDPPVLDVIHLGLGPDGHTASLVPGDPVLEVDDRDVAWTGVYQNHRRMTLTYPLLDRARLVFWLVTGAAKVDALRRLLAGDGDIPAARVSAARRLVIADRDAAAQTDESA